MDSQIKRLDNGNIELTLTLPWGEVQTAYEEVIDETVKNTEIKGFRKGHAPRDVVEKRLDRSHTLSHALQHLLPKKYQTEVSKQGLKPVVYPQIRIIKGKEGEEWEFVATLCEAPIVKLGSISKKKGQKKEDVLAQLVKDSDIKLADMLVEHEANHRLARLAENLTQLGLTVEKYLESKKLTSEDLKSKLANEARQDLSIEFVLQQVQVEHKLANRQKTLDFLTGTV